MDMFHPTQFLKTTLKADIPDIYYDFALIGHTLKQKYTHYMTDLEKEVLEYFLMIANQNMPENFSHTYRVYITSNLFWFSLLVVDITEQFFLNLLDYVNKTSAYEGDEDFYYDVVPHIWLFKEDELIKHALIKASYALTLASGLAEKNLVDSSLAIAPLSLALPKKARARSKGK